MKHFSLKELKQLSKWLSEKSQSCAKKYHEVCFFIYIFFYHRKKELIGVVIIPDLLKLDSRIV